MAPPLSPIQPSSPTTVLLPPDAAQEREALLDDAALVGDPRWNESSFRQSHLKLYFALDAIKRFMKEDSGLSEEKLKEKIDQWLEIVNASSGADKEFYDKAVTSLHAQLDKFQNPDNAARAVGIRSLLPARQTTQPLPQTPPPAAETPATPPPVADSFTAKTESDLGWKFRALGLDFHFNDESFRSFPSTYTLGFLPDVGINHNQSSKFGWALSSQFSYNDFNFFAGFQQEDFRPNESAVTYNRMGIRLGMLEYARPLVGHQGPGQDFHLSLFGRSRTGFEIGSANCSSIDGSDVSGAQCPDGSFQVSTINDTSFLDVGYGPFETGVSLLPVQIFLHAGSLGSPEINRLPISWHATWHFTAPQIPGETTKPEEVLQPKITDAQVAMTSLRLVNTAINSNFSRKQEAAFQESRLLSFGNPEQFALLNLGTMVGGLYNGFSEGSLAYRLGRDLHYGNDSQRIGLAALMGGELAINLIGMAATPGTPEPGEIQVFPGTAVPPGTDLSGNEGLTNLQARAWRMSVPQILIRDSLAALGAFGALGDRNKAIEQGGLLYPGLHGALALGGTVLILTSGDGSGTGFLGNSIMGNQPLRGSPDDVIALEQTSYDLGSQSWQYARLEAGAQLLAYGVNGVIDFATGRFRYLHLKDCEDGGADKPACPQYKKATSAGPANQPLVSGLKLNVQLDSQFQGATLSGNIQ